MKIEGTSERRISIAMHSRSCYEFVERYILQIHYSHLIKQNKLISLKFNDESHVRLFIYLLFA